MRILILSQVWEPESGTPQRRWRWLTAHLRMSGHHVTAIVPPPHYPAGKLLSTDPEHQPGAISTGDHGETIYRCEFAEHDFALASRLKDQTTMALSQLKLARKICREFKPDLIVATAPPLPAVYTAALASFITRTPLVVDLRDAWPDLLEDMGAWDPRTQAGRHKALKDRLMPLAMRLGGWTLTVCLKRAAALITTSELFSARHRAQGKEKVLTLRNFGARRDVTLSGPPPQGPEFHVLYAGTLGRSQGLATALEAMRIARADGLDVRMRILGDGVDEPKLRQQAKHLELPVDFLGTIPFFDVPQHYEWTHTTLVQLRNWRAFEYTVPSKLYEALELGRHITLVGRGESASIVRDTHSGHVVPPEDPQALAELWKHLAANRHLLDIGSGGRDWLESHGDPWVNGQEFVHFLEGVVGAS